jgi:chromosomal replication initiator protein
VNPDDLQMNRFAVKVLHRIAENPGKDFNPLFLLGNGNDVKRSFLQEIGNEIKIKHRELCIFYGSLDSLMQKDDLFSIAYDSDVLLLDILNPETFQSGLLKKEAQLVNHFLLQDKQVVCLIDYPVSQARDRLSLLFPIPEKSLLLDITPESDWGQTL